jgi:uncharacterized protein (DUF1697 family)
MLGEMRVALLRAVNVGGTGKLPMAELRALGERLGLREARTYIQTGNLLFRDGPVERLAGALAEEFGLTTEVMVRSAAELRAVAAGNPFPAAEAAKLLVVFLRDAPGAEAVARVEELVLTPEEVRVQGREMYIHFPDGMGASKLSVARLEKLLGTAGTGRNWNTVRKLLELMEG